MKISILALDGVFDTGLTVLLDTLATANELAALHFSTGPLFHTRIIGLRRRVVTALGLDVPVQSVDADVPDWVVVPALNTKMPAALVHSLARPDIVDAKSQLLLWHAGGTAIAASCIGTFLLAETGLLDGHAATTTWWLAPLFRERYPAVELDCARMLVASEEFITAGAAMGHLDLALCLVAKASPELAALVARYFLADVRDLQSRYIIPGHLAQADPVIAQFERWARSRLREGFSLDEAAKALAMSPRTLQRRTETVLGKSPLAYFQDLRVEKAQHLVRTSGLDVEAIATEVGYADGATLRTLLRKKLGRGVRELRASGH